MIQLGYYPAQQQQDESLDFDPNYDPSDFLIKKDNVVDQLQVQQTHQQYQENYDYATGIQEGAGGDEIQLAQQSFGYGTYSQQQQAFNVGDYSFQSQTQQIQQQSLMQEDFTQSQQQLIIPNDGGGLADLEISDSDDDDDPIDETNTSENPADTSKDDGLWF